MRNASTVLLLVATACSVDAIVADDAGVFGTSDTVADPTTTGGSLDGSSDGEDSTTTTTTASDSEDDGPKLDIASDTDDVPLGCSGEAPDLIYVLLAGTPQEIWSFDPIENVFEEFATIECPEIEGTISGFSLDREGAVYLMSLEPEDPDVLPNPAMQLTRFDPVGGACEVVFYGGVPHSTPGSLTPSAVDCADVAFVSMPDDPDHERLFAHKCTSGSFTMFDDAGVMLRMELADDEPMFEQLSNNAYTSVALAGTGDGRLYGVGGNAKMPGGHILEFAQDGELLSTVVEPDLALGDLGVYIALAFYAGDLYTFGVDDDDSLVMTIHRYDLDDDDSSGVHEITPLPPPDNLPGGIVAATSPTCIPLTPEG